jgi:hypothetical protein
MNLYTKQPILDKLLIFIIDSGRVTEINFHDYIHTA